jgi:mannose-6-phosphate isomerase-like protein (cupin superfamily)
MSAIIDIVAEAQQNTFYRRVVYTGENSQLVVMCIPPHGEVGAEIHKAVEQTIFIVDGFGSAVLDRQRRFIGPGDAIVVTPRTRHNFIAGDQPLKLFTVYAPPNHLPGRVHRTRADAEADVEDEEYGKSVGY